MGLFDHSEEPKNLQIDEHAEYQLYETVRWGKFLGIICIVLLSLGIVFTAVAVIGVSAALAMTNSAETWPVTMMLFVIVAMLLYIYPIYSLLKFSGQTKKGLQIKSQEMFNDGLRHLKNLFKFIGIYIIVVVCLYVLMYVFVIVKGLNGVTSI